MSQCEDELTALRILLKREHSFHLENRYRAAEFEGHVRPLVITLETFLKSHGYIEKEARRRMRLDILAFICEIPHLETTYDLTVYQCTTINRFLHNTETWEPRPGAEEFLEYCTGRIEVEGVPAARPDYFRPVSVPRPFVLPDLSDLF